MIIFKRTTILFLTTIYFSTNLFAISFNEPDFITNIHTHSNADELVQSKKKSNMTYNDLMQKFGISYSMIQNGLITQDKLLIKIGTKQIQNHPAPKNKPWSIVKKEDTEAFKATLLYYDKLLHNTTSNIQKALDSDDWILINNHISTLSNHCVNCHITWKNNLKE